MAIVYWSYKYTQKHRFWRHDGTNWTPCTALGVIVFIVVDGRAASLAELSRPCRRRNTLCYCFLLRDISSLFCEGEYNTTGGDKLRNYTKDGKLCSKLSKSMIAVPH